MANSRSLLIASLAVCIAGCSAIPFFSSDATPRNPVPKPEWEQDHEGAESKSKQKAVSETKRTPSVVWLPENQVRARTAATSQNRITDSAGQPILTGLSECIRPGYSLLDGTECDGNADSVADNETSGTMSVDESQATSSLNTDLLGGEPQQFAEKTLPPAPRLVDESFGKEPTKETPPVAQSHNDLADAPKVVRAVATSASARLIPARYERIVLSSDLVFDFAKYGLEGLSAAGKEALQGLRERFTKYDPTSFRKVVVTGHADRLGKPKSNVAISLKRAAAIKSFLISTGIDPDILEAVGVGSVSPVAHCPSKRKSVKLKSCLAPNRRVEIEIIGAT